MKKVLLAIVFAFSTVALVGCGGSSGTTKTETKTPPAGGTDTKKTETTK